MPYTVSIKPKAEKYLAGIGDARLYQIQDAVLIVFVVEIGRRREIYRRQPPDPERQTKRVEAAFSIFHFQW